MYIYTERVRFVLVYVRVVHVDVYICVYWERDLATGLPPGGPHKSETQVQA